MKDKLIELIRAEIFFLSGMIADTDSGGWPTHLNDRITIRIRQLKDLYYEITQEP